MPRIVSWGNYLSGILGNFDVNSAHPGSNGPGHWNDPDYLQIGIPGISDIEAQSQLSLWAIMASPLIIGADIETLTPAQLSILTNSEVIAIDQDPLGVQAIKVAERDEGLQVWSKVLAVPGERAVALFNRTSSAAGITVTANDVGCADSFAVRDLWTYLWMGTYSSYTVSVPSHGVVFLKLTGGTEHPVKTYAVNAGGNAQGSFIADTNGADGGTGSVPNSIDTNDVQNPAPATVYQDARGGINGAPVAILCSEPGSWGELYRVRLHFSENWLNVTGARTFNVRINGVEVLRDFDVYAVAGNQVYKAVVEEFTTIAAQASSRLT